MRNKLSFQGKGSNSVSLPGPASTLTKIQIIPHANWGFYISITMTGRAHKPAINISRQRWRTRWSPHEAAHQITGGLLYTQISTHLVGVTSMWYTKDFPLIANNTSLQHSHPSTIKPHVLLTFYLCWQGLFRENHTPEFLVNQQLRNSIFSATVYPQGKQLKLLTRAPSFSAAELFHF